jgi:16S rRNA C967 or C1407 C5-methylase (RsmB/RsmF family)
MRKIPVLEQYRAFLVDQHGKGNLNRQEAVSMIPALLLNVQPQHLV